MKFTTACFTLAAAVAAQSDGGIQDGGRKLNQAKDMLAVVHNVSDREAKNLLRNYGCFCYPQGQNFVGPTNGFNGEPVDELDRLCKQLFRAQRCLQIDSDNGEYPKQCNNDMAYAFHQDANTGDVVCGEENATAKQSTRKDCKIDMCELEKDFVSKVSDLFNNGFVKNAAYENMGQSDYEATCARNSAGGGTQSELACCGAGIERRTYNSVVNMCCNNEVSSLGSC